MRRPPYFCRTTGLSARTVRAKDVAEAYIQIHVVHRETDALEILREKRVESPCQIGVHRQMPVSGELGSDLAAPVERAHVAAEIVRGRLDAHLRADRIALAHISVVGGPVEAALDQAGEKETGSQVPARRQLAEHQHGQRDILVADFRIDHAGEHAADLPRLVADADIHRHRVILDARFGGHPLRFETNTAQQGPLVGKPPHDVALDRKGHRRIIRLDFPYLGRERDRQRAAHVESGLDPIFELALRGKRAAQAGQRQQNI